MKSITHAQTALYYTIYWEFTVHARAALQHASSTKLMSFCDHGSRKGTKKFMSSKRLNFNESRSLDLRRSMAMGDIAMTRGVCAL